MDNKIKNIYLKSLIEKATQSELDLLNAYCNKHPDAFEQLKSYAKKEIASIKDYDARPSLEKAKSRIHLKVSRNVFSLKNIAAILLFCVGTSMWYYYFSSNEHSGNWQQYAANEKVGYKKIVLKDGSKVTLENGSSLSVSTSFGINNKREVKLNGQAYFEVARDSLRPFTIEGNRSRITVLGTSFNVVATQDNNIVKVNSGKVEVQNIKSKNKIILVKHEGVMDDGLLMNKFILENDNYQSWFSGKFIFKNTELKTVVTELNSYYRNSIILPDNYNSTCKLTADLENNSIEEVIEVINLSCGINFKKVGNKYSVAK